MADNLTTTTTVSTIPSGTVISTDELAGSVHVQNVKLMDGTSASSTVVAAGGGVEANALRVTLASDSTGVVSVDDNGSSLTVDNAALSVTGGGVEASALRVTLANDSTGVVSVDDNGSSLTVDGTVAVSSVTTSVTPGTSAAHLGKAVDAAAGASDTGIAILAVRDDSLSTLTPADGDYTHLRVSSTGALHVTGAAGTTQYAEDSVAQSGDSLCVVGAVRRDSATSGAADGDYVALSTDSNGALRVVNGGASSVFTDDAAFTPGTSSVSVIGAQCDETATDSVDEGDAGALRMTAARELLVKVNVALPAGTNNIGDVDVLSIAAGNNNIGDVDVASIAAGDNNIGNVDIVTMPNVTLAAGTNTNEVVGDVAHDAAAAGNPLRVGAKAETALSGITLVADGDATDLYAGVDGVLIVRPHTNLEDVVSERTTNTDGASTAFASGLAAPGAGIRLCITSVTLCNSSASFCTVDLRDGSAGSVLWTIPVPATGGAIQPFDPPLKLTANTALAFDASAATTTLTISANGFKTKL